MPRVAVHTLGCKLNYAESSSIGQEFVRRGFDLVEFGSAADVQVINTCSVTARADQECRQMIRRALRTAPDSFVIVTGCYAQLSPDAVAAIPGVDLILGAGEKFRLFELAGDLRKLSCTAVHVAPIDEVSGFGPATTTEAGGRTRAFLKIQDGCDYACSFCTIPKARGTSRSQPVEECLRQARSLAQEGFKEIVLTGVNVGDYGKGLGRNLAALLRELPGVEGLERIRISSIEPNLLTEEILDIVGANPVFCKHFHVPLQSGSETVLRRMRRRYGVRAYEHTVSRAWERFPGSGLGADVIVGFPGETDGEFEETLAFVSGLPLTYLHVFSYSERPGTPASVMARQVPPEVKAERSRRLRVIGEKKRSAFVEAQRAKVLPVLFESEVDEGLRYGFSEAYVRVGVPAATCAENEIAAVLVTDVPGGYCTGTIQRGER